MIYKKWSSLQLSDAPFLVDSEMSTEGVLCTVECEVASKKQT